MGVGSGRRREGVGRREEKGGGKGREKREEKGRGNINNTT